MWVACEKCSRAYDDAECWTICPHGPLWAASQAYCPEHDLVNCFMHKDEMADIEDATNPVCSPEAAEDARLYLAADMGNAARQSADAAHPLTWEQVGDELERDITAVGDRVTKLEHWMRLNGQRVDSLERRQSALESAGTQAQPEWWLVSFREKGDEVWQDFETFDSEVEARHCYRAWALDGIYEAKIEKMPESLESMPTAADVELAYFVRGYRTGYSDGSGGRPALQIDVGRASDKWTAGGRKTHLDEPA